MAVDVVVKQGVVWVWPENLYNPPMFGEKRAKPDEKLIPIMDVIENVTPLPDSVHPFSRSGSGMMSWHAQMHG